MVFENRAPVLRSCQLPPVRGPEAVDSSPGKDGVATVPRRILKIHSVQFVCGHKIESFFIFGKQLLCWVDYAPKPQRRKRFTSPKVCLARLWTEVPASYKRSLSVRRFSFLFRCTCFNVIIRAWCVHFFPRQRRSVTENSIFFFLLRTFMRGNLHVMVNHWYRFGALTLYIYGRTCLLLATVSN